MSRNDMLGVHEVKGVVTDLIEKLGGADGRVWLLASKRFLRKENPWAVPEPGQRAHGSSKRSLRREKPGVQHVINCSATPHVPDGWSIQPEDQIASHFTGEFIWSPDKVRLHLDPAQEGGGYIVGVELAKKLEGQPVLPANVLDYLLNHPELIPSDWRGKAVFFWGTVYCVEDGNLYVRCLCWNDGHWSWHYYRLGRDWHSLHPAAVSAS